MSTERVPFLSESDLGQERFPVPGDPPILGSESNIVHSEPRNGADIGEPPPEAGARDGPRPRGDIPGSQDEVELEAGHDFGGQRQRFLYIWLWEIIFCMFSTVCFIGKALTHRQSSRRKDETDGSQQQLSCSWSTSSTAGAPQVGTLVNSRLPPMLLFLWRRNLLR
jgi:hypothetical protein